MRINVSGFQTSDHLRFVFGVGHVPGEQFLGSEILAEVFMWRIMTSSGFRKVGHGLFWTLNIV